MPNRFLPRREGGSGGNENEEAILRFDDPQEQFRDLRKKYEFQTNIIIGIFGIAIVTLLIITGTLVVDSFHFNSVVYQQYTQSNQLLNQLTQTNAALLQANTNDQATISTDENLIKTLQGTK